MVSQLIATH